MIRARALVAVNGSMTTKARRCARNWQKVANSDASGIGRGRLTFLALLPI